jgi:hypothetical protein
MPLPLILRKIFKREDLGVDLSGKILHRKDLGFHFWQAADYKRLVLPGFVKPSGPAMCRVRKPLLLL